LRTVLITGGAGFIGSHTAWACLARGWTVVIVVSLVTGVRALAPKVCAFYQQDCTDYGAMLALMRTHTVTDLVHPAAITVVPELIAQPGTYHANNVGATIAVARAAAQAGVERRIFSSSAAVYAPTKNALIQEISAIGPVTPYGRTKSMGEHIIADLAAAHGLRWAAMRYFNAAGADPQRRTGQSTPRATHLIKVACEAATGKRAHLDVFGTDYDTPDGTCVRDFIHVSDLADAHAAMLAHLPQHDISGVDNCGYGKGSSVRDVISAIEHQTGTPLPVRMRERRPGDLAHVVADPAKLRAAIHWAPRFNSLDQIVADALAWERNSAA
jgi:UDP-glucose 4-epimerase